MIAVVTGISVHYLSNDAAEGLDDGVAAVMDLMCAAISGNLTAISTGGHSSLDRVQQSHFRSQFGFQHFDLQIEIQIGIQMRRIVISHLKPILNTSKFKIEMQIEIKWYIYLSVQQVRQIVTLERKLR